MGWRWREGREVLQQVPKGTESILTKLRQSIKIGAARIAPDVRKNLQLRKI